MLLTAAARMHCAFAHRVASLGRGLSLSAHKLLAELHGLRGSRVHAGSSMSVGVATLLAQLHEWSQRAPARPGQRNP
jgi:hypothetical protein